MNNIHFLRKALLLVTICMLFCLIATGCRGENGGVDYLKYQGSAFSATLMGRINGIEISAGLSVKAETRNEDGDDADKGIRDLTLTIASPDSLSGIRLTCVVGEKRVSIGGEEYSEKDIENIGSYVSGWIALAEGLIFDGEVDKIQRSEGSGETCVTFVRPIKNEYCKIMFDCGGDIPIPKHIEASISGNEISVSVQNFSFD